MKRQPFLLIIIALIGTLIYLYNTTSKKPESATNLTPKQYIELVEKRKLERRASEKAATNQTIEPNR